MSYIRFLMSGIFAISSAAHANTVQEEQLKGGSSPTGYNCLTAFNTSEGTKFWALMDGRAIFVNDRMIYTADLETKHPKSEKNTAYLDRQDASEYRLTAKGLAKLKRMRVNMANVYPITAVGVSGLYRLGGTSNLSPDSKP